MRTHEGHTCWAYTEKLGGARITAYSGQDRAAHELRAGRINLQWPLHTQPNSPQMFLAKSKGLATKTTWMSLPETLPTNVFVWAEKDRWNNGEEHAIALKILGFALRPYPDTMHPIVYFDSARTHPCRCMFSRACPTQHTGRSDPAQADAAAATPRHACVLAISIHRRFIDELGSDGHLTFALEMIRLRIRALREVLQAHTWKQFRAQWASWQPSIGPTLL